MELELQNTLQPSDLVVEDNKLKYGSFSMQSDSFCHHPTRTSDTWMTTCTCPCNWLCNDNSLYSQHMNE